MDKLTSLRAFVKVVETGSFAEAGRQLRLSRSAISKYISELEQDPRRAAAVRTTRHASPNRDRPALFRARGWILADLDAADQAVASRRRRRAGYCVSMRRCRSAPCALVPSSPTSWPAIPNCNCSSCSATTCSIRCRTALTSLLRIAELESSAWWHAGSCRWSASSAPRRPISRNMARRQHAGGLRRHASLTYGFLLTGNQWKLTGTDGDHWIQPAWTLCVNNAEVLRDVAIRGQRHRADPDASSQPRPSRAVR